MSVTLLGICQDISSAIDGDEFNSISDTFESEQIATIVKNTYKAMSSNRNWPRQKQGLQIPSYGDISKPTHLVLPSSVKELISLSYDKKKAGETRLRLEPVVYQEPDAFLRKTNNYNSDNSNVQQVTDPSGVTLLIRNDIAPTSFTSFDDKTIVFDSYDSAIDSSIQESKTQAFAYIMPTWSHVDSHEIDLPEEAEAALLNECISVASVQLRQTADAKAEQTSVKQQRWLSRKAWSVNGGVKYPNYGRASRKRSRNINFERKD